VTGAASTPNSAPSFKFTARHRLTHARQFAAVYDARVRKTRPGLMIFTKPNGLLHHRLGLAVSARTIPKAVDRNRAKRIIREAFRLSRPDLARGLDGSGFDIIVSIRARRLPPLAMCQTLLQELLSEAAAEWRRRARPDG
jgi:ribonuclease P protein component